MRSNRKRSRNDIYSLSRGLILGALCTVSRAGPIWRGPWAKTSESLGKLKHLFSFPCLSGIHLGCLEHTPPGRAWFSQSLFLGVPVASGSRETLPKGGRVSHAPRGNLDPQKQRFIKPCPTWGGVCSKLPTNIRLVCGHFVFLASVCKKISKQISFRPPE